MPNLNIEPTQLSDIQLAQDLRDGIHSFEI